MSVQRAKIQVNTSAWYNPDLKSRNYNVPGVIAFVIMLVCLLLTSMAVVREREIGTMEQLMVTPLRPIELMLGEDHSLCDNRISRCLSCHPGRRILVRYPDQGILASNAFGNSNLSPVCAGNRSFHIHHIKDTAAGAHGNFSFLCPCCPAFRFHVPYREHAKDHTVRDLYQPPQILPCDNQGNISQGQRHRNPVAADAVVACPGAGCHDRKLTEVQKEVGIMHAGPVLLKTSAIEREVR